MIRLTALFLPLLLGPSGAPDPAPGPIPVEFQTADGVTVHGWYMHAGEHFAADGHEHAPAHFASQPAVVLLHMYGGDKSDWGPLFGDLRQRGIASLAIDLRGHGESVLGAGGEDLAARARERDPALFRAMWQDAQGAADWLVARGHRVERIGLLGASVGCSVAIDAARRNPELRVAGVLTPGQNYLGVPTLEHLKEWGGRQLLVVSSGEEWAGGAGPVVEALAQADGSRVGFWRLPGAGIHGTRMLAKVEGIQPRLAAWFEAALAAPALMEPSR
ncbi:MAG: alpha/beta fold hydrolase [Planctomycetes bacterium]|nr:alpha/beta fold hydrolase [Planctomycetota bacterium]